MLTLLSSLCGEQTCVNMADFPAKDGEFLHYPMRMEHRSPNYAMLPWLFWTMDPGAHSAVLRMTLPKMQCVRVAPRHS